MEELDEKGIEARLDAESQRFAAATVYSLHNSYLSISQKHFVERWFGPPCTSFGLTVLISAIFRPSSEWWEHVTLAAIVSAGMAAFLLSFPNKIIVILLGSLLSGATCTVLTLCIAIYLIYLERWGYAAYGIVSAFALDTFLTPGMWVYILFGGMKIEGTRMHPKYAIAKRVFGIQYPFERSSF